MAIELFLVPMEGSGTHADPYRAKYTRHESINYAGSIRYSKTDSAIALINAPQAYLNAVREQPDALSLATPQNINEVLTAGIANAAKTLFEGMGIPAGFINAGDTRREVIRGVIGMFLFSQRMEGRFGAGFRKLAADRGVNLNTPWSDFPQALRNEFIAIRDEHGWDNLGLTNQSTLRQILLAVAERYEDTPMFIAGVEI